MAKNLRAKIPEGDSLTIYDVNTSSMDKLSSEASSKNLHIAKSPREVAEKSVRDGPSLHISYDEHYCSIYDLSWGYGL